MRWTLAPLTACGLLTGVVATAPASGASSTACVVNPGATGWTAADIAKTRDGHAIWGVSKDTGAAWANMNGYSGEQPDGRAVDVALIDSGVAPVAGLNSGNVVHGPDLSYESQSSTLSHIDTLGHGTVMASIIAGREKASFDYESEHADSTKYYGIAPKSRIVSVKVADSQGAVDVTQVISAIDWVVAHAKDKPTKDNPNGFNIRVINLSYGVVADDVADVDALSYAAEQAWKAGITVVAAAGNGGRSHGKTSPGLTSPAYNDNLIAVGSYDNNGTWWDHKDDFVPEYTSGASSSNKRLPDFVAPAQHITGMHVKGSTADEQMLDACRRDPDDWTPSVFGPNDRFLHSSGTSQAAAIASGAAALMLSKYPNLTPDQVKRMLAASAQQIGNPRALTGDGALDLHAALRLSPSTERQRMTAVGGGTIDDARGSSIVYSCMGPCVALTGDRNIFGKPIVVGSSRGPSGSLQKLEAGGAAWVTKSKCATWMGAPMLGVKFVDDKRLGKVWQKCSWPRTNWAGQKWTTDNVHTWNATGGYWQGNAGWSRFSLTGRDWTRFSLRDNGWD